MAKFEITDAEAMQSITLVALPQDGALGTAGAANAGLVPVVLLPKLKPELDADPVWLPLAASIKLLEIVSVPSP